MKDNKRIPAAISLFIMSIIWGLSYTGVEDALRNGWGPFPILFLRTFVAAVVLVWFTIKKSYKDKNLFIGGFLCGLFGFLGLAIQSYGQTMTTVSETAFISSMYIILVPILMFLIFHKKESPIIIISCVISILGCVLLNMRWPLSFDAHNLLGNALVLISAIFFAAQILVIAKYSRKYDTLQLTVIELVSMAFLSLLAMSIIGDFRFEKGGLVSVLWVGLLSSGLCSVFQMWGEKHVPETISGIIMGLESLFGAIFALIFFKESLTWIQVVGCVFIFVPVILCQIPFKCNKKEDVIILPKEETNKNENKGDA